MGNLNITGTLTVLAGGSITSTGWISQVTAS
jgi:hypothetical protein